MRCAILSGGQGWHVRDLQRAATAGGHEAAVVDFRRIAAGVAVGEGMLASFDGVLVRTVPAGSLEQVVFRMDLLQHLMARGVSVLNPPRAIETCVDKYLASTRLEAAGLLVPPTIVCQQAGAAQEAFAELGGDVVVKPLFGSEGRGMMRISDADTARKTFQDMEQGQSIIYLQAFIQHPGWDLRVFVLGDRVLGAMRRRAQSDWRTNIAQGGIAEPLTLGPHEKQLALRAASAVNTAVAGVDLLQGPGGDWYVLEVNAVPGWQALSQVSQVDVAAAIWQFFDREYRQKAPTALPGT
jgi:ribosomal protein S6--L-glutamate ligase